MVYIIYHPNGTTYVRTNTITEARKKALSIIYKYYPIEGERKEANWLRIYKDSVSKDNLEGTVYMNFGKRITGGKPNRLEDYPYEDREFFKIKFQDHYVSGNYLYKLNKDGTLGAKWMMLKDYPPMAWKIEYRKRKR